MTSGKTPRLQKLRHLDHGFQSRTSPAPAFRIGAISFFIPQIGEPKLLPGAKENPDAGYRARFSHDQEYAAAGYYKVKLLNNNVTVELTAAERAGMMRLTFPQSGRASILTDLRHFLNGNVDAPNRFKLIWSHLPGRGQRHHHRLSPDRRLGQGTLPLFCGPLFAPL